MPTVALVVYGLMSLVTLALLGWDKRRARRSGLRVSERTLHTVELLGGWPGSLLGSRWFRHKTQKLSYRLVRWIIVLLHVAGWAWFLCARSPR